MNFAPCSFSSSDSDGFSDDNDYYEFKEKLKASRRQDLELRTKIDDKKKQLKTIFSAITFENSKVVFEELDKGLDIDVDLENGWTPLLLASSTANKEIISGLLERNANVNQTIDKTSSLMLLCSITNNSEIIESNILSCVKLLVERNADVSACDKKRRTAIMMAANNGHLDTVKFLLPLVDKNTEDNQHWNVLFWAVDGHDLPTTEFLLKNNFILDKKDIRGNTIADLAHSNGYQDILDLLPKDPFDDFYFQMNNNFYFEDTFKNLKRNQKPQFFFEICKILHGTKSEQVVTILNEHKIDLLEFLSMSSQRLEEMGVQFPYQRARIINGLYKFHKHSFKPQSIKVIKKEQLLSNIDIASTILTCVKQIIVMEASLRFIMNNKLDELSLPQTKELRILLSKTRCQIGRVEKVVEALCRKTEQWDQTIKPVDKITKKRRNIPWCNLCLSVGLLSLFIWYKLN